MPTKTPLTNSKSTTSMIQLAYTILYVKDVQKSMTFYATAFGLQQKFTTPDGSYGELSTGETTLSFASISMAKSNLREGFTESDLSKKPFGIEIGFTTDNVEDALKAAVKAGATVVENPKTKPWGQIVAYVRDMDGFLIEICTSMA